MTGSRAGAGLLVECRQAQAQRGYRARLRPLPPGVGDSDFTRARRQQQVLLALRSKLTSAEMLPELPNILDAAGDTVRTNFPSERVGEMIGLAQKVDTDKVRQYVLGPSKYAQREPYSQTGGIYKLQLKMDALAKLSVDLFGNASRYAQPPTSGSAATDAVSARPVALRGWSLGSVSGPGASPGSSGA